MIVEIERDTVDELYTETLQKLQIYKIEEETRGGPVLSFPEPVLWTLTNPRNRVLINPIRDANPFFHAMEFIWMMSGEGKIDWITQFSKKYGDFAQDYAGYGYRWRKSFYFDQIRQVILALKKDPQTRRAVLTMWAASDVVPSGQKEVPCNLMIALRNVGGQLDMTVTNRSNDIIYGALGANVVHMTMLHELIAHGAGLELGVYRAFSINAHMYQKMPRFDELYNRSVYHRGISEQCRPILQDHEKWEDFIEDCENMVYNKDNSMRTEWMAGVAESIFSNFFTRSMTKEIQCPAWRRACGEWLARRQNRCYNGKASR